jgi:hypothetical protein
MGSYITLSAGNLELDWGKDDIFQNHSKLFSRDDVKDVPYYYAYGQVDNKKAFCRKLRDVVTRLELLGYSIPAIQMRFVSSKGKRESDFPDLNIDFQTLCDIMRSVELGHIKRKDKGEYGGLSTWITDVISEGRQIDGVGNLADNVTIENHDFFDHMDPYSALRLLIENHNNLDYELCWRYSDVVEGGWVQETDLFEEIGDKEKFLIVTEGSSDLFIIKKALEILRPDIFDFFSFVDMAEHYPFTGTGNLFKFSEGLASIGIQNKVLIVYDNDTIGRDAYERTKRLKMPVNVGVVKLPELTEFEHFLTVGPSGQNRENINGKAVSIEHFLDLNYGTAAEPVIRWTSWNDKLEAYQGLLVDKEKYVRLFGEVQRSTSGYNFSKLESLVDFLYGSCGEIGGRCASGLDSLSFWYF